MNLALHVLAAGARVKPRTVHHYYPSCYSSCSGAHLTWQGWVIVIGLTIGLTIVLVILEGRRNP